jgi:hypothetical protein
MDSVDDARTKGDNCWLSLTKSMYVSSQCLGLKIRQIVTLLLSYLLMPHFVSGPETGQFVVSAIALPIIIHNSADFLYFSFCQFIIYLYMISPFAILKFIYLLYE